MPTTSLPHNGRTRSGARVADPDDDLLSELNAPPPLDVCREALDFWTLRRAGLPRLQRRARRDAAAMIARWEERLREAELAEHAAGTWHQILDVLGVTWPTRSARHARIRRITLMLGGGIIAVTAALMAMAVVCLVVAYEIVAHVG
jgi:hypothetical protein